MGTSSSNPILGLRMLDTVIQIGYDHFFSHTSLYAIRNHPAKRHMQVKYPSKES